MKHCWRAKPRVRKFVVVPGDGIACPGCGHPTQVREHSQITERHRRQLYYFKRWFRCMSNNCPTTLIVRDEFKVWNDVDDSNEHRLRKQGDL
jgi:hypothetical protein